MFTALSHSEAAGTTRSNLAALILRLSLAAAFLSHGLDKIVHADGGADWVNRMYAGMPEESKTKSEGQRTATQIPAQLTFTWTQLAVAWGEFLGGLALACGMLTRLAALGLIAIQVGAVILVTLPRGFRLGGGGFEYEYNLALIVMCLALLLLGPGMLSVDRMLMRRRAKKAPATAVSVPASGSAHDLPAEQMAQGASS